jgi:hypothetical protein
MTIAGLLFAVLLAVCFWATLIDLVAERGRSK